MKTILRSIALTGALALSMTAFGQNNVVKTGQDGAVKAKPVNSEPRPAPVAEGVELTTIEFDKASHDFGKIKQGEVVKHQFTFKNAGESPLKLENVKPSCGCTATQWPREEIAPGESAVIEAQFNSAGKLGRQMKYITVVYNGNPKIERLTFTGEVAPKVRPTQTVAPVEKPVKD